MKSLGRWLLTVACAALMGAHGGAMAQQDAMDRLDNLRTLSEKDNTEALKQLQA